MSKKSKPRTYNADLAHLPAALLPLTPEPRWVVWPWELRRAKNGQEKWTKPPRMARDPKRNAKSDDPSTWGRYQDAVAAVSAGRADGIGFMLKGSNIGAIDLDHCVERDSGKLDPWAEQLHNEAADAYQEITVSGGGTRIIGTVSGPETQRRFSVDRRTGAGIELYRNCARYITISGLELGSCAALPPLDAFIDTLLARFSGGKNGKDHNAGVAGAGAAQDLDYDDLIRNGAPEGQRSELFQAVVWHLANQGWSAEQITDELARYPNGIGAKYAKRLHEEVTRAYEKWRAHKRAASGAGTTAGSSWPQIRIRAGELPRVVDEAEHALLAALGHELYQRGGLLVRPVLSKLKAADDRETASWQLIPVTRPYLVESLTRAGQFLRYDLRMKKWTTIDAPDRVADAYLARQGEWQLPVLTGIVNAPFLRNDSSPCEQPGYEAISKLLLKPEDHIFPPIPQFPDKTEAAAALKKIEDLIATFPFITDEAKSVALSAILTTLDRRVMRSAPMHAFTSPTAGTGKSLLVDLASILATGRPMPVISQGRSEEELEKRLGAAFLAGDAAISIDNCEHPLQSVFLCQALTQSRLNVRMLGYSKNVETLTNTSFFATGNNLSIVGDLARRSLLCSLDAKCEHPERRSFKTNVVDIAYRDRGPLVVAALTALRAWHVANQSNKMPELVKPLGSFEDWSYRVRSPLIWLGYADPCKTIDKVKEDDPQLLALDLVLIQWEAHIGAGNSKTVQEVINAADPFGQSVDLYHALLAVAAGGRSGNISNERLGRWLKRVKDRVIAGRVLRSAGRTDGYGKWMLNTV